MRTLARLAAPIAAVAALIVSTIAPASAYTDQEQWEMQIGQQEYQQLAQQGKIVTSSPLYAKLNPVAKKISAVADRQYFRPFRFILVRDNSPNAFAVPGGNVYVTTAMMSFAQNEQELAGVLCHETSHDIHHDVYNLAVKNQRLSLVAGLASLLVGNSQVGQFVVGAGAQLESLGFSRPVESSADHTGAYICAAANENPWGMVWLFQRFEDRPSGVPLEMLSDHPRDDHRVADLQNEFASNPSVFGRFSSNKGTATPL